MTSKKRGLGKGLSALISEEVFLGDQAPKDLVTNIAIDSIVANKKQPRMNFQEEALKELADSIKIHGVIQPILVRKTGEKHEIIAGERRWRAAKMAGLVEMPCLIREMEDRSTTEIALIENIQREDLNPIEEAIAYKRLVEEHSLTQEEVSDQIGKSRSYITNSIRLLNLHREIIESIAKGDLTTGHGKVLLSVKDKEKQLGYAKRVIADSLNVRETEELIKDKEDRKEEKKTSRDPYVVELEESLMRVLGTKVKLKLGNKKGKIEIEYYGNEDLERIIELLTEGI